MKPREESLTGGQRENEGVNGKKGEEEEKIKNNVTLGEKKKQITFVGSFEQDRRRERGQTKESDLESDHFSVLPEGRFNRSHTPLSFCFHPRLENVFFLEAPTFSSGREAPGARGPRVC